MKKSAFCLITILCMTSLFLASCSSMPKNAGSNKVKNKAESYAITADGLYKNGEFSHAVQYYKRSLTQNILADNIPGIINNLNSLGHCSIAVEEYDDAFNYFQTAYDTADEIDDNEAMAVSLSNLGLCHLLQNDTVQAETMFCRALEIAESDRTKSHIYYNFGLLYHQEQKYPQAMEYAISSAEINQKLKDEANMADIHYLMASIYMHTDDTDNGEEQIQLALELDKKYENTADIAKDYRLYSAIEGKKGNKELETKLLRKSDEIYEAAGMHKQTSR
ncbi:MAG: tetratricopeptide repeat protein [Spirochaetia bacterium]|nr:tetratricopeptide repeat protein [Spirochaetia bacterium]